MTWYLMTCQTLGAFFCVHWIFRFIFCRALDYDMLFNSLSTPRGFSTELNFLSSSKAEPSIMTLFLKDCQALGPFSFVALRVWPSLQTCEHFCAAKLSIVLLFYDKGQAFAINFLSDRLVFTHEALFLSFENTPLALTPRGKMQGHFLLLLISCRSVALQQKWFLWATLPDSTESHLLTCSLAHLLTCGQARTSWHALSKRPPPGCKR